MNLAPLTVVAARVHERVGLKGREAAALLEEIGVEIPARANAIVHANGESGPSRCLRLGSTEFVLEHDARSGLADRLRPLAATRERAWLTPRSDFSAVLTGAAPFDSLSRYCSFDFDAFIAQPDLVVMTLLADISVTLALEPETSLQPRIRLWADPGYARYLTDTLTGDHP
jgi:hypothetical protein